MCTNPFLLTLKRQKNRATNNLQHLSRLLCLLLHRNIPHTFSPKKSKKSNMFKILYKGENNTDIEITTTFSVILTWITSNAFLGKDIKIYYMNGLEPVLVYHGPSNKWDTIMDVRRPQRPSKALK
jgi:hypothetical protein